MDLISVIVPVYNVEKYLKECVDSLINQTYKNIEIILVDDGSTDGSSLICDEIAKKDDRIQVYHKKNGGLSDARNYGIEKAAGSYICFVDSDDYVEKDYINSMFQNIKKYNTRIAACGYCHLYENGGIKEINFQNIKKIYYGDEAQKYLNIIGYFNVSSCNKLFEKKLFNDIRFPVGKKSEDWFVMYKLIEKANSIYYDSDSKYIYRQRAGSITKGSKPNTDAMLAAKEVFAHFKNNKIVKPYAAQSLAFAIIGIYNFELCNNDVSKKEYIDEIRCLKKEITYDELSISRKIQLYFFIHFSKLYDYLIKMYKKKRK